MGVFPLSIDLLSLDMKGYATFRMLALCSCPTISLNGLVLLYLIDHTRLVPVIFCLKIEANHPLKCTHYVFLCRQWKISNKVFSKCPLFYE